MDIGVVIEGQEGLTWPRWQAILSHVDGLGLASLFRSDHYFTGSQTDSLEAFVSLTVAAAQTRHVRFGTLVTPVTFRRPADVARMAAQIDDLSGGRFVLGMGIGWYRDEHEAYGVPFPPVKERFDRLEEAVEICRLLWADLPATYDGRFYSLRDADCRPKPTRGTIPIIIGGTGEQRALRVVAQHADEWCSECISLDDYRRKTEVLDRYCVEIGRDPREIRRSMVVIGDHVPSARRLLRGAVGHATRRQSPPSPFAVSRRAGGLVQGGRHQIVDLLARYAALGLQEAVFKLHDMTSVETPEYLASEILPEVRSL